MPDLSADTVVFQGADSLKSLEVKDGQARVGAYAIRFSASAQKDLQGEYFTANTDFGPRHGDGVATMFNHGMPIADGLEYLAQKTFAPVKAVKDDIGIFIETCLNLSDDYEKAIADLVMAGKLKWSSGTSWHLTRKAADGQILRWHPIEFSYTPTPAESRLPAIAPLKSVVVDQATAAEVGSAFSHCHPERSAAESKDPVASTPAVTPRASSTPAAKASSAQNDNVDTSKAAEPRISITPPKMTEQELADQKAAADKAAQKSIDDRVSARTREVEEIYAIADQYGCRDAAKSFINDKKSLQEFQNHVLTNVLKAKPLNTDAGVIGMNEGEKKSYSILRAIRQMCTKQGLEGLEKEAHEAALKASGRQVDGKTLLVPEDIIRGFSRMALKAQNVGTATAGGYLVDTDMGPMIELLRNKPQVVRAGATTLGGLVGDVVLPVHSSGATAYWVAETAALTDSQSVFAQKKLSPKRLGATIPYSTQFLAQTSMDAESFIRNDAVTVLSIEKDRAALAGTGATGEPIGVANTTGINATVTYSNAAVWADIVEHETGIAVDNADIGSMAFMIDATTRGKWKTALKDSVAGADYLINSNTGMANGYPVYVTNQTFATAHQSFFGVWSQLILASWSGMEVIVDPYALKKSAQVEITFNELCDILVRQPLAFNVSTDSAAQ